MADGVRGRTLTALILLLCLPALAQTRLHPSQLPRVAGQWRITAPVVYSAGGRLLPTPGRGTTMAPYQVSGVDTVSLWGGATEFVAPSFAARITAIWLAVHRDCWGCAGYVTADGVPIATRSGTDHFTLAPGTLRPGQRVQIWSTR